jgi:hypothetical protein
VKQPGRAEEGIKQALQYAFNSGVPFILLSDGKTWSFYLPAEQGNYEERRVYKIDLFERSPEETVEALTRYLQRKRVESGQALEDARAEYHNANRRTRSRQAIRPAWDELVESGEDLLFDLIAEAVERKVGVRPESEDIADFLEKLSQTQATLPQMQMETRPVNRQRNLPQEQPRPNLPEPRNGQRRQRVNLNTTRAGTLRMQGNVYQYPNAKEAMMRVLNAFANQDPSFIARCASHPDAQGRSRRYIARTPEELYPEPNQEHLRELYENLPDGWKVTTNINNVVKKRIIRIACEVAGLRFGTDVSVEF